jgi:hypothetical protein
MRRASQRALILIDLLGLAVGAAVLCGAAQMSRESTGVGSLPELADGRVLALDLFNAQRQATIGGQAVTVRFDSGRRGRLVGYRVELAQPPIGYYRFRANRLFGNQFEVTSDWPRIEFLPDGLPRQPAVIRLIARGQTSEVRVDANGGIRVVEEKI